MLSDAQRHDLYTAALESWGPGPADALMALVPPDAWSDIARRGDLAALGSAMRGEMAGLRGEMAELRGEMARLRAHVDSQLPKLVAANIASMIAVAGLVLTAVSVG